MSIRSRQRVGQQIQNAFLLIVLIVVVIAFFVSVLINTTQLNGLSKQIEQLNTVIMEYDVEYIF